MRHVSQGRLHDAVPLLQRALKLNLRIPELHNNLGLVLFELQKTEEAVLYYRNALAVRPGYAVAANNLGVAMAALDRHAAAIAAYRDALKSMPEYPEAANNLASSLHKLGRHREAIPHFRHALKLRPDFSQAWTNLGRALVASNRPTEAIACYQHVVKTHPDDPLSHLDLAEALREAGRLREAIGVYRTCLELNPELGQAHAGLGQCLLEIGNLDHAAACFRKAVAVEPGCPGHFLNLVRCRKVAHDPCVEQALNLQNRLPALPDPDKTDAHFAISKVLADIGRQSESFSHLLAANSLKRKTLAYDEPAVLNRISQAAEIFTADFIRAHEGIGISSAKPIFIVGMPRSGSTLLEQVLASHPQVFGAGETEAFGRALCSARLLTSERHFPGWAPQFTQDQARRAAKIYLGMLERKARTTGTDRPPGRITDKLLFNFRYLGLIHLLFRNACIIHTVRNPIDTCLSAFSIQFRKLPFTYDLGELGRFYNAYSQLMEYWRRVLPPGRIFVLPYEAFVSDFEPWTKRLLAHCGLEWHDACLRFFETKRPVRTASVAQVRQPLFTDSIARWRPEGQALRPLLQALSAPTTASPISLAQPSNFMHNQPRVRAAVAHHGTCRKNPPGVVPLGGLKNPNCTIRNRQKPPVVPFAAAQIAPLYHPDPGKMPRCTIASARPRTCRLFHAQRGA